MKKYYWTQIYQVSKIQGYIKSGEEYHKMTTPKEQNIPYTAWTLMRYNKIIIVEEIFPFVARKVTTGILFPIVNFKNTFSSKIEYQSYPFIPIHTFVGCLKDEIDLTYTKQSNLFKN